MHERQLRPDAMSINSIDPTDPCLWIDMRVCDAPRSCFDCLNTAKGQCMVDPIGRCVQRETVGLPNYFSSSNTSYCNASDAICAACRTTTGRTDQASYCVGVNGCVCITACEIPTWRVNVLAICPAQLQPKQTSLYVTAMVIAGILTTLLFCFTARKGAAHVPLADMSDDLLPLPSRRPARRFRGPELELSGWHSMRQKVMDAEAGRTTTVSNHREREDERTPTRA